MKILFTVLWGIWVVLGINFLVAKPGKKVYAVAWLASYSCILASFLTVYMGW